MKRKIFMKVLQKYDHVDFVFDTVAETMLFAASCLNNSKKNNNLEPVSVEISFFDEEEPVSDEPTKEVITVEKVTDNDTENNKEEQL